METLIELVKQRPIFYDHNNAHFQNREKKLETWAEVAQIIGSENGDYWRIRWDGLKINYYKYRRSIENPANAIYRKYRKWPWARHMQFLDKFAKPNRKKSTNMKVETVNGENPIPYKEDLIETAPPIPQTNGFKKKKKKKQTLKEYFRSKDNPRSEFDEVENLFLSYAKTFKRFPRGMQQVVKLEMVTLFARYELLNDTYFSVASDSNSTET